MMVNVSVCVLESVPHTDLGGFTVVQSNFYNSKPSIFQYSCLD